MQIFRSVKQKIIGRKEGQSLVEVAIAAPLLILMFIGVFEVGWALRGYLVLANVNREAARFAVKNAVLDFSVKNPGLVGYNTVLSHTTASLATQLPLDFLGTTPNSTMIMSHMVIDTGYPCVKDTNNDGFPDVPYQFDSNCNCQEIGPNAAQWFTRDDLILQPQMPGYAYFAQTYGISRTTRIGNGNYAVEAEQLVLENNQLNCTILKTGNSGELSMNNVFIAETFYDQPQLLGVPIISNHFTDPIPFYTHTAMRIVASRESNVSEMVGPACELYPLVLSDGVMPSPGMQFEAYQSAGELGWLAWNPAAPPNQAAYISEAMINPRLPIHDFTDAVNAADHRLDLSDHITSNPAPTDAEIETLANSTIRVPVFSGAGGSYYTVAHFAVITVNQVCLVSNGCTDVSGSDKLIRATFLRYEDDACQ